MRLIRKEAEFVGYLIVNDERRDKFNCPNKKCGVPVSVSYSFCPYCGQKISFAVVRQGIESKLDSIRRYAFDKTSGRD